MIKKLYKIFLQKKEIPFNKRPVYTISAFACVFTSNKIDVCEDTSKGIELTLNYSPNVKNLRLSVKICVSITTNSKYKNHEDIFQTNY